MCFIQSLIEGPLGCFQVLAMMKNAAMNIEESTEKIGISGSGKNLAQENLPGIYKDFSLDS